MTEEQALLRDYTAGGSREALDELVRRFQGLVYSAALRQVRDPHLAEDVTQAVFLVLAQKAGGIKQGMALGGWLLTVTRRAAVHAMKRQTIQHRHERAAARPEMAEPVAENWNQIAPVIDGALSGLSAKNRDAVVLRFFQDQSFAQIGAQLGLTEDTARKRVARALERLRKLLSRRGTALSLAALSMAISTHAVMAAPPSFAAVAAGGAASPTPQSISLAKGVIKMLAYTKAKIIGAVAATVILGGAGVIMLSGVFAETPAKVAATPAPVQAVTVQTAAATATLPTVSVGVVATPDGVQTPVIINMNEPIPGETSGASNQITLPARGAGGGFGAMTRGGGAGAVGGGAVSANPAGRIGGPPTTGTVLIQVEDSTKGD